MRGLLLVMVVVGCAEAPPPPPAKPVAPAVITVAVIEFGGSQEAEDGCVRAVLDAGHHSVDKKHLDATLPNDDDIDYQRLGHALSADLIIDGGLARGVKLKHVPPPRIVSARKGDVLASSRVKKRLDKSYQTAHEICADLLNQLP